MTGGYFYDLNLGGIFLEDRVYVMDLPPLSCDLIQSFSLMRRLQKGWGTLNLHLHQRLLASKFRGMH